MASEPIEEVTAYFKHGEDDDGPFWQAITIKIDAPLDVQRKRGRKFRSRQELADAMADALGFPSKR